MPQNHSSLHAHYYFGIQVRPQETLLLFLVQTNLKVRVPEPFRGIQGVQNLGEEVNAYGER